MALKLLRGSALVPARWMPFQAVRAASPRVWVALVAVAASLLAMPATAQSATFVGAQTTLASSLGAPSGIAVDSANTIYVADTNNARILVERPGASGYTQTVITNSAIVTPVAVAVDTAGNLYVVNRGSTTNLVKLAARTYTSQVIASNIGVLNSVAVTPDGSALYVVDAFGQRVFQFVYSGGSYIQQTTVTSGITNPLAVSTDATGAWYLLESGTIAKHAAGFSGSTFVGTLVTNALSSTANALDIDGAGDIFVADTGNNRIVEEVLSGSSYTLRVLAGSLNGPKGVGVDSNGIVFFTNTGANIAVAENLAPVSFGTVNVGTTSAAQTLAFIFATSTTLNGTAPYQALLGGAGNLDYAVIAGSGTTCTAGSTFAAGATCTVQVTFTPAYPGPRNGALLLNDSNGAQTGLAYLGGVGSGPQVAFAPVQTIIPTTLNAPLSVALDGSGNLYVADGITHNVIKETYSGGTYTSSSIGSGLSYPTSVAVDGGGNLYITDYFFNNRVVKEAYSNGVYVQSTIALGSGVTSPNAVAVDGAGNLYISDISSDSVVKEVYNNGTYIQSGVAIGSGYLCLALTLDGAGNVYIVDYLNKRLLKETYGNGAYTQSVIPTGVTFNFSVTQPSAVAVDGAGDVYITDNGSSRVLRVAYNGGNYGVATVIGSGLTAPQGLALDSAGNVYIATTNGAQVSLVTENVQKPPSLSFASTAVGTTSADSPQQVAVSNTGDQPLTISSVTLSPATNFTADASACLTTPIVGGGSCAFNLSYTPAQAGSRNAMALIYDNTLLAVGSRQQVQLTGTGTKGSQTIAIVQPVDGATYAPGATLLYSATSTAPGVGFTFQIRKTGTVTYSSNGNGGSGGTLTITGGSGTITFTANSPGSGDYNASASVSVTINVVAAPASGASLTDTAIGSSTTATVSIPVTSNGTLSSVQGLLQGATGPASDYSATLAGGGCVAGQALTGGEVCTVTVTFTPSKAGPRYGAVELLDASGNIIGTAYLQANGIGPQVAFAPVQAVIGSGFSNPSSIAVDGAGNVYIADAYNNSVVKEVYNNGTYTQSSTPIGSGLNSPAGLAVDGTGNVYIADLDNHRVVKEVYSNGTYTQSISIGSGIDEPSSVAVDGAGNLYIADSSGNRIVKEVYSNGTYTQSSTSIGSGLQYPVGVAVDGAGNVYIADYYNNRVVKEVYSNGIYTQSSTPIGSGLSFPAGVTVDGTGNVYIADGYNNRVVKEVYSNGIYTQSSTPIGSGLNFPVGVTVDGAGNVYIADADNDRALVERVDAAPAVDFTKGGTASTATGATSAPIATTITNLGNQPLVFPVPNNGLNPQTAANFALETNSDTTCPVVNAGGTAGQLAANATCTLSYVFAPTQLGTLMSNSVLTDNNLNAANATQSITLKGQATQGTQTAQTITFPQPAGTVYPGSATLAASASSGLPVTYTLVSGPATLSGSTLTYTGPGAVVVTANQAGNVQYSAAPPVSITINVTQAVAQISWAPAKLSAYTGFILDATILDATDSIPATITYTAQQPSGTSLSVDSTSYTTALTQQGTYRLTAQFVPGDSVRYATTSLSFPFLVQNMNVFVANAVGSVASLYNNGTVESAATSGGGLGASVDNSGFVWSVNADGKGVSRFDDTGKLANTGALAGNPANVGGISAATALTVDGNGRVWVVNGNGTVSALVGSNGSPQSVGSAAQAPVGSAANLSSPASITVDPAGSLWIANSGNNTVTEIIGVAAPVTTPLAQSVVNNTVAARP